MSATGDLHLTMTFAAASVVLTPAALRAQRLYTSGSRSPIYFDSGNVGTQSPSATEVRDNGISIGEMQSKLLAEVEELMLCATQGNKRTADLELQLRLQKESSDARMSALELALAASRE